MRVFIGFKLPETVCVKISEMQKNLQKHMTRGKLTRSDNLHLTLVFIGEVEIQEIPQLVETMKSVAQVHAPFCLKTSRLGAFYKKNRMILWLGVDGHLNALHAVYTSLETQLVNRELLEEKNVYTPHITLGRQIKLNTELEQLESIDENEVYIHEMVLFESKQVEGVLRYIPIETIELGSG